MRICMKMSRRLKRSSIPHIINLVTFLKIRARRIWRHIRTHAPQYALVVLVAGSALVYTISHMNRLLPVDPTSAEPLLALIARAESRDNYNAHFGKADNQSPKFTEMTIAEVFEWQDAFVAQGNPSSAVGRYQIINTTLADLVDQLRLDLAARFDEAMQDRLALALLERRGARQYVSGRIDARQFAAELAKEWAGLPRVIGNSPEKSYYAGDGLNAALVGVEEVLGAVRDVRASD